MEYKQSTEMKLKNETNKIFILYINIKYTILYSILNIIRYKYQKVVCNKFSCKFFNFNFDKIRKTNVTLKNTHKLAQQYFKLQP